MRSTSAYWQPSLFGSGDPSFDAGFAAARRVKLDAHTWVEHVPRWLAGDTQLFAALREHTRWTASRRWMYDREVDVPRLTATLPEDGEGHPVVWAMSDALSSRYGRLDRVSLALYRHGSDSVAWHSDNLKEPSGESPVAAAPHRLQRLVVAIVALGDPRRFLLRRAGATGEPSRAFSLGWGDLLVMGPGCQTRYEHAVPKAVRVGPRIALMFRARDD